MSYLKIEGQHKLRGTVTVSGSKNAAIKLIAATLLASKPCTITNVPDISDVAVMLQLVENLGARVTRRNHTITIDPRHIRYVDPDPALVGRLRASLVLIGPYLARFGKIKMPFPGGDLIGKRPIDTHIQAFQQLGVLVRKQGKYYIFTCAKLRNCEIYLSEMSVTTTENILMAVASIPGKSIIHGAASEPEIVNLADFLTTLGARIDGAGSPNITVHGKSNLSGGAGQVIPDRLEAGALLIAALITKGAITVKGVIPGHLSNLLPKLQAMGARITITKNSVAINSPVTLKPIAIDTRPYPGFSTDLQSPMAAALTQARGDSSIFETLFEGRFNYVDELVRMGAKIEIKDQHRLIIHGKSTLRARKLYTPHDIRAGGAFILAALAAKGVSEIYNLEPIDRGYDHIDQKLALLGAKIERI